MRSFWKIAGSVAVWAAIVVYLAWAVRRCTAIERDMPARGVEVVVKDSARLGVITAGMVKAWIAAENLIPANATAREIPVAKIEKLVRSRGFVKQARVFMGMDGVVHIEITQRQPVMRFNTLTGYNFYVTDDGWVLPSQAHAAAWLPIVTGNYTPPFERGFVGRLKTDEKNMPENYQFLHKLINFVQFIRNDAFWSAQVEQVIVTDAAAGGSNSRIYIPQVEIVPRAGNHIVMLGELDDYRAKFDKLLTFYQNGLKYEGWDAYRYIDLKYKNQIVCTK